MKNNLVFLRHMLDAAERIEIYLKGADLKTFLRSDLLVAGVCRELGIIGEAANHVDRDFQKSHPEIPWSGVISLRNYLIHEYFGVNRERVWETVKQNLPMLKKLLLPLLKEKN